MIHKLIIFAILLGILSKCTGGTCVWPSNIASTTWKDNSKGNISFTTDKLIGWTIAITAASPTIYYSNWKCHSTSLYTSSNIIVSITENTFMLYGSSYYGYICLKLTAITDNSYRYYVYSPENNGVGGERVNVKPYNNETDLQTLCLLNNSTYRPATYEYRVMIKTASTGAAKIDCPYVFLGSYDYTHLKGTVTCDTSSDTWSTCQDSKEMRFNYSTCPTKVAYSKSNTVWCVDTVPYGDNNYVTVYNGNDADADIDNVNIYRFSCFAISSDGTEATVVPNQCRNGQTSNTPTNIGSSLTMTRYTAVSCPTCPSLVPPNSGSLSYSTDGASTTVSYTCSSQYSLSGPSTRACQSNRTWADKSPTCTCILPAAPANGSVTASTNGTLTYSCNVGFVLNGTRTRTCQNSSNTWSGVQPSCDPCDAISSSAGLVTSLSSTGVTTVAAFTCSIGYTLNGATSATCLVSKNWNPSAPACVSASASPDTEDEGSANLVPAVVVLAILTAIFAAAFGGALIYIRKIKNATSDSEKSKENGPPAYHCPSAKAPLNHMQHIIDARHTSLSMAAPVSHNTTPAPSRMDMTSVTPITIKSAVSAGSLLLDLVRGNTASSVIFTTDNPAPWSKKPSKEVDHFEPTGTSGAETFPPISRSPVNTSHREEQSPRKKEKKQSLTKQIKRQSSVDTRDDKQSNDKKNTPSPKPQGNIENGGVKSVSAEANGTAKVPRLNLSGQPEGASTPVNHGLEVRDQNQFKTTPWSNVVEQYNSSDILTA